MLLAISKEHRLDRHKISPSSSRFPSSQDVMESMITATTKPSRPAKPPRGSLLTRSIPSKPQTDDSHNNSSPTSKTTIKVTMPVKKSRITPIGHHRNFIEINKSNVSRSNSGDNNVAINHQQSGNRSFRSSRLFNGSFSRADILDSSIDDSSSLESSPSLTIDNSNSNRRPTAIPIPIPPTRVSRPIGLSKYNFKASSLAQLPTSDIMADSPTSPTTPFLKSVPSSMSNEFQENRQRLQRQLTSTGFGIRFNSGRQHVFQNHAYPLNRDFTSLRNGVTNNNLNKTENGKDHGDHHPIDLPSPSSPSSSSSHYQPPKHPTCLHQMNASKIGILNRTKLADGGGRRLRKNWSSGLIGLSRDFLILFKDTKISQTHTAKPDIVIELAGSMIDWSPEKSSRKNVFRVTSPSGQQVLLQDNCSLTCKEWFDAIKSTILKLPCPAVNSSPKTESGNQSRKASLSQDSKKENKEPDHKTKDPLNETSIKRTKSQKDKQGMTLPDKSNIIKDSSNKSSSKEKSRDSSPSSPPGSPSSSDSKLDGEDPSLTSSGQSTGEPNAVPETPLPPEKKKKIRERLRLFLRRRPTLETLREKGIFKDEPVFGCTLSNLCSREKTTIPKFVKQCIQAIEAKDLKSDGIYRVCGNLSQVQKIRFQVNQENYSGLWSEEDVHVLTGLLKMFFRDMKEPLLPCSLFEGLIKSVTLTNKKDRLDLVIKSMKELKPANHDTLKFLLQHLLRVKDLSDDNRMHIQNLAIVFGPTLMWAESEKSSVKTSKDGFSHNGHAKMDSNQMNQHMLMKMKSNQLIEFLLLEFDSIFPS